MAFRSSILALDATTNWCSVAWTDGSQWVERNELAGQRHSELILAMVDAVLREARTSLRMLTEIAFGAGPGSFTGLRIACGIAQGLAFGAGVPVRPVSSLAALAQASGRHAVVTALDARMNEVYWAAYRASPAGEWETIAAPAVAAPVGVTLPAGTGWAGVGNGFAAYPGLAERPGSALSDVDATVRVTARAIAELALAGYGVTGAAEFAVPHYVRDRVAQTSAERNGTA